MVFKCVHLCSGEEFLVIPLPGAVNHFINLSMACWRSVRIHLGTYKCTPCSYMTHFYNTFRRLLVLSPRYTSDLEAGSVCFIIHIRFHATLAADVS